MYTSYGDVYANINLNQRIVINYENGILIKLDTIVVLNYEPLELHWTVIRIIGIPPGSRSP